MKSDELRPIGTTFTIEYPPSMFCTDTRWSRLTYKVTAHVKAVVDHSGYSKLCEEINCIGVEYFDKSVGYTIYDGCLVIANNE